MSSTAAVKRPQRPGSVYVTFFCHHVSITIAFFFYTLPVGGIDSVDKALQNGICRQRGQWTISTE